MWWRKQMSEDETVSFSLELNVEPAELSARKLFSMVYRTLGIIRRLSGSDAIEAFIAQSQRAISYANKLRLALRALQVARMAAGDPVAWAFAAITIAEV